MKRILVLLAMILWSVSADAATITVCPSSCTYTTIQAAANAAVAGDVIELTAGATYTESVILPVKSGASDITITTDADASDVPAAGVRMAPSYSAFLPKIQAVSGGSPAFRFAAGAHHWKLQLIEIPPNPEGHGTLISVGAADGTQVIPSQMPYSITIDRVLGYGDAVYGQQRAVELHAKDVVVTNSYFYNLNAIGRDSQVIVGWNGTGPYRIENNYLNGSTENVMFGGGDPAMRTWLTVSGSPSLSAANVAVSESGGHALIDLKIGEWISIWTGSGIRHTKLRSVSGTGASGTIGFDPIDVLPLTGTSNIRQDAVASDIIIRNNTFSKTAAYMDGILATPTSVSATPNEATGTLAVGTWYYRISAVNPDGYAGNEVWSGPSTEVSAALTDPGQITLGWTNSTGSTNVTIWRGTTAGGETQFIDGITGTSWTDTGAISWQTYSPGPPAGRKWQVKNLFEIKAARRVTFTGNILETAWKGSDIGFTGAWIKSVNQDSQCWSCGSSDILIEHNVFRHIYGWLELHGTEAGSAGYVLPPPLTNVTVRNNLVYDSSSARWGEGGDQYAVYIGDYVVNPTLEHNTIDHNDIGFKGFIILDGVQGSNTGAVIRGNIFRKNTYGVHSGIGTGTAALAAYTPGYIWQTNVMEGASSAQYPAGTLTPNDATYEASFVDYEEDGSNNISDWALDAGSAYNNAAWDGTDVGVDMVSLLEALAVVEDPPTSDLVIVTATLPNGALTAAYAQSLTVSGGDPNVGTTATIGANSGATYTGFAETQIKEVAATTNYGSDVNCSVERWDSTDRTHCLVKASGLSSIPSNAVVTGARIRMYLNGAGQSALATNINVRRLTRNVNHSQATWNVYSTGNSWGTVGGIGTADRASTLSASAAVPETLGYVTFTGEQLTADVQGMVDGSITNYGWILERDDSLADFQWRTFTSSEGTDGQRPVLEVDYVVGGAYSYSVTTGALPTGLALNATTGAISGTPSVAGTYNFTIEVEDDAAATDDQAFQVIVKAAASVTTTTLPNGAINAPYTQTIVVTGDEAPYTWTVESGTLPSGFTLSAGGVLAGIPAELVTASSLTVRVTGSLGSTDTQALLITIIDGPTIASGNLTVTGDRLRLNYGDCRMRSGSGSPEGVLSGHPCDMYIDTSAGVWHTKWSGVDTTTGWGVGHNATSRVNGDLSLTGFIGHPDFVSQLSRWRIDATGGADFRYLYTDELHAKVFIADLEQALAGGQIISKSVSTLAAPFTCPAPGGIAVLTVDDLPGAGGMQVFQSGDSVVLRTFARAGGSLSIGNCVGVVTAPSTPGDTQNWTFTRNTSSAGGTMPTSTVVPAGGLALDYGTSGNGIYEVNAVDGAYGLNSPYMQIATWATAPVSGNFTLRTRCGNLRGITAIAEYGCIFGTYGTGSSQYIRASDQAFEVRNINLDMYSGSTKVISLDRTAPSLAIGATVPSAYGTGTGIWMGMDSGVAKFRVGNPAGNRMEWNGSTLNIYGNGSGLTSIGPGSLTIGSGRNLIRNSDCRVSTDTWTSFTTSAATLSLARSLSPWRVNDEPGTCYITTPGTPVSTTTSGAYITAPYPVVAGNRYEASAYLAVHRSGNTFAYIVWLNAAGGVISQSSGNNCTTGTNGGLHLGATDTNGATGYCRSGVVATAPSGAVNARPAIATTHDGSANPYVFFVHTYFGESQSGQTELTPWGPAGITSVNGGDVEANSVTVDKMFAVNLASISADLGTVTAGTVVGLTFTGGSFTGGTFTGNTFTGGSFSAGGGNTVMNASGLSFTSGAGASNGPTWSDGGNIRSSTGLIRITNSFVSIDNGSAGFGAAGSVANVTGTFRIDGLAGGGNRTVCVNNDGDVSAVTGACP